MSLRDLVHLMDHTWPAHSTQAAGGWQVREGRGGGNRVSSASVIGDETGAIATIPAAESLHRRLGQKPIFRLLDDETDADKALAGRGYAIADPTLMRLAETGQIAESPPAFLSTFPLWPPLVITELIWAGGDIGPERRAIMEKAPEPKTVVLGRADDHAAGAVFVGIDGDTAMVHALHVAPEMRRRGLANNLMRAAAGWAADHGADQIGLAVTKANRGANALYDTLGFETVGSYHYRIQ